MPGFRSYNAFLRSAKSQLGLTHHGAQRLYRSLKQRLGSAPTRLTLRQHPRISKQEASKVLRPVRAIKAQRSKRAGKGKPGNVPLAPTRPVKKPLRSIRDYERVLEESSESDVEKIGAGVDTGRKKRR